MRGVRSDQHPSEGLGMGGRGAEATRQRGASRLMSLRQRWKFKRGADWLGDKSGSDHREDGEDRAERRRSGPERRNQCRRYLRS